MESILGLEPTGRELRDPAARLIEAQGEDGRTYTVIDFDSVHDGHESLTLNVEMVLSFMEYPMVTGLVELGKHDVPNGLFAYPTGSVWLLADILRAFGDFGQVVGLRAAMELAWLVGQILVEAGDTGPMQGCFSHGNLNPWRIALRADGEVQVLGYGLPQVELIRHRDQDGPPIDASSLRYCPPERLEGVPEDASSDTYSLVLVCFEVATGKPLYTTHDVSELERMVGMSEGAQMLSRDDRGLPPKVAKMLAKGLVYDPDTRLTGQDFVDGIGRLLATEPMEGPSLTEVVATLQGHQKRGAPKGRKLVSAADTSMFTPQQLAEMVDDDEDAEDSEPKQESRWKKADRNKGEDEDDKPKRRTRRGDAASKPRRQRRRGAKGDDDEEDAPKPPRRRKGADDDAKENEAPPKRKRRRKAAAPDEEPETAAPAKKEEPPAKRSRRRRKAAPEDDAAPAPQAKDEEEAPPKPSRRRRKAPDKEPKEATTVPDPPGARPPGARARKRKAPPEEKAADAAAPKPSRRRRKAPDEEAPPAEEKKPSRRRRKAPAEAAQVAADKEDDAPPRRRRKAAPDQEDDAPRRRRRPVDDDDDEAPRRRRRARSDDDDDDDAPPRRRRKKPTS